VYRYFLSGWETRIIRSRRCQSLGSVYVASNFVEKNKLNLLKTSEKTDFTVEQFLK